MEGMWRSTSKYASTMLAQPSQAREFFVTIITDLFSARVRVGRVTACYGGACLRKFAAPTAGPGRMGQLAKNALETSRYENENMRSAKSILDLPVVYRHSASGPPAASRQRLE